LQTLHETRPSVQQYGDVERESDVNTTPTTDIDRAIRHNGRVLASEKLLHY
jgi:hypothetical protein